SLMCLSILRSRTWRAWIGIGELTLQNDQGVACHSLAIPSTVIELLTVIGLSLGCHRSVVIIGKATGRGGQVFHRRDQTALAPPPKSSRILPKNPADSGWVSCDDNFSNSLSNSR